MNKRFEGKTVLITGANGGIGRAAAKLFAAEGARLVVAGRRVDEGEKTLEAVRKAGGKGLFVRADVSKSADCKMMVSKALEFGGKLDVAFNNASIVKHGTFLADMNEADWNELISINLSGVYLSMKYEIPAMIGGGGGVILNTSSVGGLIGNPGIAAYCAAKHGVIGLTKSAALEYIGQNVRINALCPGGTETDMLHGWLHEPALRDMVLAQHPIGRFAAPEEMARTALALCSDDTSFLVGTAVAADGGFTAR